MEKSSLVSIIIVNYNGRGLLQECFKSLTKVDYPNYEIILVDNNSVDDSIEFVKNNYPPTIIIKLDKNYGFAYPNNVGAKNAKGKYFVFLNNDTQVTPNFISEMVKIMENDPKIGLCQSLLLRPNGEVDSSGDFIDKIGISFSSKEKVNDVSEILSAKGASMMIRKSVFEQLGGFDEKFFVSFEDIDFGWRSWIHGHKAVVVPKSIVYHMGGHTIKSMKPEIAFHSYKNQLSMKITNFETSLAIKNFILFFLIYGLKIIRVFFDYRIYGSTSVKATPYEDVIFERPQFKVILKGIFWLFRNVRYLHKKHNDVNSSRVFSTKELENMKIIHKMSS